MCVWLQGLVAEVARQDECSVLASKIAYECWIAFEIGFGQQQAITWKLALVERTEGAEGQVVTRII